MRLLEAETIVLGVSYLLAALPVGGILLAGRMSPVYRVPARDVRRWWSWCALLLAVWLLGWTLSS
jgi:hypothetical protein